MYNKYQQRYDVLGRFFISGKEYCRVKFLVTKHEQIVTAEAVKSGNFQDDSVIAPKVLVAKTNQHDVEAFKKALEENKVAPVVITEPMDIPVSYEIIATNPKGDEIKIKSLELEEFCAENKLDIEVVHDVIEGKQKTHRKWRFARV